jgi:hypothetical protein
MQRQHRQFPVVPSAHMLLRLRRADALPEIRHVAPHALDRAKVFGELVRDQQRLAL